MQLTEIGKKKEVEKSKSFRTYRARINKARKARVGEEPW